MINSIKSIFQKNKKAQFYLFVAVVLCIISYGLFSSSSSLKKVDSNEGIISSNYLFEAKTVVNNALYKKTDPSVELNEFTSTFINYAKTKNINLQIAYLLKVNNSTKVVNYLKDELNVTTYNRTLKKYETLTISQVNIITLKYEGMDYTYTFTNDTVELKALIITN